MTTMRPFILLCFLAAATATLCAQSDRRDIDAASDILRRVKATIRAEHYDPKLGGGDFDRIFVEAERQLTTAKSTGETLAIIAQAVDNLGDSHTAFLAPPRPYQISYGWRLHPVGAAVYVEGVRPDSDASKQGVLAGERVVSVNNFPVSRQTLRELHYILYGLNPRPRLRVVLEKADGTQRKIEFDAHITPKPRNLSFANGNDNLSTILDLEEAEAKQRGRYHEIAPGLIAWKLKGFSDPADLKGGLRKVHDYDHIILDLRGNGGGLESAMLEAIGAFFDHPLTIGTLHKRHKTEPLESERAPHPQGPIQGKLYVLVDGQSASAAEIFARTMQLEGRAIILGDLSSGHTNRSLHYTLSLGSRADALIFGVSVSESGIIMRDGQPLEKIGVTPDVWLLPSKQDLATGADPVLAKAAKLAGATITKEAAGKFFTQDFSDMLD